MECGMPFPAGYTPYSLTGDFEPGDVEPDYLGRSQLNLYLCAPYGNYKIDIEVFGQFEAEEGKRIGWEIEDGQTQVRCQNTKLILFLCRCSCIASSVLPLHKLSFCFV